MRIPIAPVPIYSPESKITVSPLTFSSHRRLKRCVAESRIEWRINRARNTSLRGYPRIFATNFLFSSSPSLRFHSRHVCSEKNCTPFFPLSLLEGKNSALVSWSLDKSRLTNERSFRLEEEIFWLEMGGIGCITFEYRGKWTVFFPSSFSLPGNRVNLESRTLLDILVEACESYLVVSWGVSTFLNRSRVSFKDGTNSFFFFSSILTMSSRVTRGARETYIRTLVYTRRNAVRPPHL